MARNELMQLMQLMPMMIQLLQWLVLHASAATMVAPIVLLMMVVPLCVLQDLPQRDRAPVLVGSSTLVCLLLIISMGLVSAPGG